MTSKGKMERRRGARRAPHECPNCGGTEMLPALDNSGRAYEGCARCTISLSSEPPRTETAGALLLRTSLAQTAKEMRLRERRARAAYGGESILAVSARALADTYAQAALVFERKLVELEEKPP